MAVFAKSRWMAWMAMDGCGWLFSLKVGLLMDGDGWLWMAVFAKSRWMAWMAVDGCGWLFFGWLWMAGLVCCFMAWMAWMAAQNSALSVNKMFE